MEVGVGEREKEVKDGRREKIWNLLRQTSAIARKEIQI